MKLQEEAKVVKTDGSEVRRFGRHNRLGLDPDLGTVD